MNKEGGFQSNFRIEDLKEKLIILINKGINVLDEFYTNICYNYHSSNGKDVPIKARIITFFANITLCDGGSENVVDDIQSMKAKQEYKFTDLLTVVLINDNMYGKAIKETIL